MNLFSAGFKLCSTTQGEQNCDIPASIAFWGQKAACQGQSPKTPQASDALCREYGLSVIDQPEPGKSKQYGEWRAEQENRPTWRGMIRAEIDEAIRQSMTERQFFENLRKRGYEIKVGADISVRPPGKPRFVRLKRNFGEDYTLENIRRRILAQQRPERPLPEPEHKTYHARLHGDFKNARKITGFRALYFHYCYLLGIFPKNQPNDYKSLWRLCE